MYLVVATQSSGSFNLKMSVVERIKRMCNLVPGMGLFQSTPPHGEQRNSFSTIREFPSPSSLLSGLTQPQEIARLPVSSLIDSL